MKYNKMIEGRFVRRRNRFIAEVLVDDVIEEVHVRNTGRLRELFLKDVPVLLEPAANPERKTRFSLVCVKKNEQWISVDSTAPNQVVEEMARMGRLFSDVTLIKREKTFGKSRFDLYVEHGDKKHFIEVKGVTLEVDGVAKFPDAPTERGVKHIRELMEAKKQGYEASIVFVIQMKGVHAFMPNWETHKAFGEVLREARDQGVEILAVDCKVTIDGIEGDARVPVVLDEE